MSDRKTITKNYYKKNQKRGSGSRRYYLEPGTRGFFCTCNFREQECVKEAYNILNEYADKLYPNSKASESNPADGDELTSDITDELKKQVEEMRQQSQQALSWRRFQAVDTGAKNCVFIRTNIENPQEITTAIFTDLLETKQLKTRLLLRMVPILATCKANMLDIKEAAGALFDKFLLKESSTFSIVFNRRFNNSISRDKVIEELADLALLKNINNKVDLKKPKLAIIVEIIKGICLLSIVENFYEYRKFNLFEVCKDQIDGKAEAPENNSEGAELNDSTVDNNDDKEILAIDEDATPDPEATAKDDSAAK